MKIGNKFEIEDETLQIIVVAIIIGILVFFGKC